VVKWMIAKAFFVTSGKAVGKVSSLNSFDMALKEAGIEQCNLVAVSSIIPPNCEETEPTKLPVGAITYVVLSKAEGKGKTISAGLTWTKDVETGYGVVAEASGNMDKATTKAKLDKKIREMAKIRGLKLGDIKFRIETLKVPPDSYGCVVAALVYIF